MKLKNKKTGEIVDYDFIPNAHSIAELNEKWEDYIPLEPLIKDEKIRETVKAWAELFNFKDNIRYMPLHGISGHYLCHLTRSIDIPDIEDLKEFHYYTIAELCGEEIVDERSE